MEFRYICSECGRRFPIEPQLMVCPQCSAAQSSDQPLFGVLEVELTGEASADWEIASLLPVEPRFFPPIPVGNTPLWAPRRLRRELDFPGLYIKDDGLNPTCSLKDRASFLVSAFATKFGIEEIVLASTGNAGSSMAGVGAAACRPRRPRRGRRYPQRCRRPRHGTGTTNSSHPGRGDHPALSHPKEPAQPCSTLWPWSPKPKPCPSAGCVRFGWPRLRQESQV